MAKQEKDGIDPDDIKINEILNRFKDANKNVNRQLFSMLQAQQLNMSKSGAMLNYWKWTEAIVVDLIHSQGGASLFGFIRSQEKNYLHSANSKIIGLEHLERLYKQDIRELRAYSETMLKPL